MIPSDFDFEFPTDRIALHPLPRGEAKLLVVSKTGTFPDDFPLPHDGGLAFGKTGDLIRLLNPGDALALNDTKVLRARLRGRIANGSECEILLLKPGTGAGDASVWECMAKPGRKLKVGTELAFGPELRAEVLEILPDGERILRFNLGREEFLAALEKIGEIPLPPYIRRLPEVEDSAAYQSVFAKNPGSVAAPTASLHLSIENLQAIEYKGVIASSLTLHIGAGTFRPVQTDRIEDHPMHAEVYSLSQAEATKLNGVRNSGGRIFAVGTTAARVLETCADEKGVLQGQSGETRLFAYPGYRWKTVDALFTNFHWPRSTLFMLVCSMLGSERTKAVYAEAFKRDFRLFSYGDAMLIL